MGRKWVAKRSKIVHKCLVSSAQLHSYGQSIWMIFYVVELSTTGMWIAPSWKYPRNLESPRVVTQFGNDSMMMVQCERCLCRPSEVATPNEDCVGMVLPKRKQTE
ncbi:hypothetical protein AVEN_154549-1 [Araneus ventricosus]|uniref:Uncharacterized protein n=1 Tax=Araneus ventricosus TaxID=182803 RepID=A0A4Y2GRM4_ARAVE|nr:hypothetical protein AVEN_154549-1 [Araneus ventricosus]